MSRPPATASHFSLSASTACTTADPPIATERLANVPTPRGTSRESPKRSSTSSSSTPSRSAASWAKVVSWPWPWGEEPLRTSSRPVRQELGLGGLEQATGALDVHAEAGAHDPLRVGAALGLHELLRELEAARVVARVVGPAERGLVGKLADQVAAPQLERVDGELAGGDVDRALHEVGGLGPARSAIGAGGHLVGAPAHHLDVGRADVVHAAHQHRGGVRRDRGGGHQVAAEVGPDARRAGRASGPRRRGRAPPRPPPRAPGRRPRSSPRGPRPT